MLEWCVEQKSLAFQIPLQRFISPLQRQTSSLFLSLTIFPVTVGLHLCTACICFCVYFVQESDEKLYHF